MGSLANKKSRLVQKTSDKENASKHCAKYKASTDIYATRMHADCNMLAQASKPESRQTNKQTNGQASKQPNKEANKQRHMPAKND